MQITEPASPDSIDLIHKDLEALWNRQTRPPRLAPMFYEEPRTDGLISVGVNPAFSADRAKGWNHIKGDELLRSIYDSPSIYYAWTPASRSSFSMALSLKAEKLARDKHKFYKPVRAMHAAAADFEPMDWQHLDLFFVRATEQNSLKTVVVEKLPRNVDAQLKLSNFGAEQFVLFERLLELHRPRMVVVLNALASRIYRQRRSHRISYDNKLGCYMDFISGRSVPVFFCGHLAYLDTFSRERLHWHIRHVLDHQKIFQSQPTPLAAV